MLSQWLVSPMKLSQLLAKSSTLPIPKSSTNIFNIDNQALQVGEALFEPLFVYQRNWINLIRFRKFSRDIVSHCSPVSA